ncbi:MAG: hypothetical protein LBG99_03425 [Propionibacteriaceae bacterium]|jgi:hypothetical protein|nr:hypothetical protein [Propionibacteriaceae bacterium]
MATTLPRIQITLTDQVQDALEAAASRWPDAPKSKIATQLIVLGSQALADEREAKRAVRRKAIAESQGILSGAFPDNFLEELRKDW